MPRRLAPLAAVVAVLGVCAPADAAQLQTVATGLDRPTYVTSEPADASRLYATEQAGRIKLLRNGTPTSFLDVATQVDSSGYEEGLLSMAFAPDYATTGRFWIAYTAKIASGAGNDLVVEERKRLSADRADPDYSREVIRVPHTQRNNHNGGQIQYGPDGMLWIATGDGGGGFDPDDEAENPLSLLGKILRVDPLEGQNGYAVPPDNPYAADGRGGLPAVWSYGLRNPWRFSFDRATGDLTIADVGQNEIEEVDFAPAATGRGRGADYGWDLMEGNRRVTTEPGTLGPNYLPPVVTHTHADGWISIAGGYVVRDPSLPGLDGCYVYTDTYKGALHSADLTSGTTQPMGIQAKTVVSFGEDAAGRVYVVSQDGATGIQRLVADPGSTTDPADCTPPAPVTTPPPTQGPGTPAGTPTAPTPSADRAGPVLSLATARRQRALRRRSVVVRGVCGEACDVRVSARLGRLGVKRRTIKTTAGRRWSARLRLGPRAVRTLRRSLARGKRPVLVVGLRAVDAAGNATTRTVRVRLVG